MMAKKIIREKIEETIDMARIKQLDTEPESLLEGLDMVRAILLDHEMRMTVLEHVTGIRGPVVKNKRGNSK